MYLSQKIFDVHKALPLAFSMETNGRHFGVLYFFNYKSQLTFFILNILLWLIAVENCMLRPLFLFLFKINISAFSY